MKDFLDTFKDSFVQCFDDSGKGRRDMVRVFPASDLEKNIDEIKTLNSKGAGVFFTPNPCKGGRKEENVTSIKWVYVDMDNGTKPEMQAKIKSAPIIPHIIVESSRSYHLYWRVDCSKTEFDIIIRGLIQFFDGDPAISSTNEVLRLPSFYHMKEPNSPFLVKIIFKKIQLVTASEMVLGYPYKVEPIKTHERGLNEATGHDETIESLKRIPIKEVLESLGVEVRHNFIWENGEETSASINVSGNYINRFSGKVGSGNPIHACMYYGNMDFHSAIKHLRGLEKIHDVDKLLVKKEIIDPIDITTKPFTWGTQELDRKISPIQPDSFVIFAGETGAGKTAWSFDCALKNAILGHEVLYISLEMSTESIFTRVAREYAGIDKERWRDKRLITEDQKMVYRRKKRELASRENFTAVGFDSGMEKTMENIEQIIERSGADLVFLDNFDLIEKDSKFSEVDSQNKAVSKILQICKGTPKPMVVMHHLRKGDEKDLLKPRNLTSIRGSGKISDGADMVLIGFRAPYNKEMSDEEKAKFTIIQRKDRDFGTGGLHVCYFDRGSFQDKIPMSLSRSTYDIAKEVLTN